MQRIITTEIFIQNKRNYSLFQEYFQRHLFLPLTSSKAFPQFLDNFDTWNVLSCLGVDKLTRVVYQTFF